VVLLRLESLESDHIFEVTEFSELTSKANFNLFRGRQVAAIVNLKRKFAMQTKKRLSLEELKAKKGNRKEMLEQIKGGSMGGCHQRPN